MDLPWQYASQPRPLTEKMTVALVGLFRQRGPGKRYYPRPAQKTLEATLAAIFRERYVARSNTCTLRVMGLKISGNTHRALARRGLVYHGKLTELGRHEAKSLSAALILASL